MRKKLGTLSVIMMGLTVSMPSWAENSHEFCQNQQNSFISNAHFTSAQKASGANWQQAAKTVASIKYAACMDTPEAWDDNGLIPDQFKWRDPMTAPTISQLTRDQFYNEYDSIVTDSLKRTIQEQESQKIKLDMEGFSLGEREIVFDENGRILYFQSK